MCVLLREDKLGVRVGWKRELVGMKNRLERRGLWEWKIDWYGNREDRRLVRQDIVEVKRLVFRESVRLLEKQLQLLPCSVLRKDGHNFVYEEISKSKCEQRLADLYQAQ